ncbi:hypothetical protein [Rufibacter aurantiacus]|uniref:hypothetical protein n=1 Tax=Rufibacter aurantiacus TaxID=2817374 RepID=UPI001B30F1DA|nr:hypothetical protein [Rufibacter aurantiacus]
MYKAATLTNRVSNEMDVNFMEDGRVLAWYHLDTNSLTVAIQTGQTPVGPFQPAKKITKSPRSTKTWISTPTTPMPIRTFPNPGNC